MPDRNIRISYHRPALALMGIHRSGLIHADTDTEITSHSWEMLARTLNTGNVIAFVGSGVSASYGYDRWDVLIKSIATRLLGIVFSHRSRIAHASSSETVNIIFQFLARDAKNTLDAKMIPATPAALAAELAGIEIRDHDGVRINDAISLLHCHLADLLQQPIEPVSLQVETFLKDAAVTQVPGVTDSDLKLVVAESCRKWFDRLYEQESKTSGEQEIRRLVEEFLSKPRSDQRCDVIQDLFTELGISRFITLNYDENVESELRAVTQCHAFSYGEDKLSDLVEFGFSPRAGATVLHLHGALEGNESPLVVAERDYQRLYVHDTPEARRKRRTFEAILSANPVLFLGVGMTEEDVLRPFRRFLSERRVGEVQRPLFALINRRSQIEPLALNVTASQRRLLYSRYGVKVVYYNSEQNIPSSFEFATAVKGLVELRQNWWERWRRKPKLRKLTANCNDDVCFAHGNSYETTGEEDQTWEFTLKRGCTLFLGEPGSGKGWVAAQIANTQKAVQAAGTTSRSRRVFVANLAFTDDLLNVLETACDTLQGASIAGLLTSSRNSSMSWWRMMPSACWVPSTGYCGDAM